MNMKNTSVLTDVTSYTSAEEYLVSNSLRRSYEDPFALQSYSGLIQTLLMYENIYVAHPTYIYGCSKEHFGKKPKLLLELFNRGVVKPLDLGSSGALRVKNDEESLLSWLQSEGADYLNTYLTTMQKHEEEYLPKQLSFAGVTLCRLRDWARYQYANVRSIKNHHLSRIPTRNGIEEDSIGDFSRSFATTYREKFSDLDKEKNEYLVATILRGLRYRIRANIAEVPYQPHVMRRDFVLKCDFHHSGVSEDYTQYVIGLVRGIPEAVITHAGEKDRARVELLNFSVPLLGGKLWGKADIERYSSSWIEFVADRIMEFRDKAQILRDSVGGIKDEEDVKKLERDFGMIQEQLLEALKLKQSVLSETEKILIKGGLAIADPVQGFPNAQGLLIRVASLVKRKVFSGATPLQQFVYKEFLHGWKETKSK